MVGCRHKDFDNVIYAIPRDASGSLYVMEHAGMTHAAERAGMKIYWNGPRGSDDTEQEIELVERAIGQRNAGIVLTPTAAFALDTAIQRALTEKIPVVILGAPIPFPPDPNLTFVLTDLDMSARLTAEHLCNMGETVGEVAVTGIDPVTPGSTTLVSSFEKHLAQCAPALRIVSKVGGAGTIGQAEMTTAKILREHPKLVALFALNSTGTIGGATALRSMHRGGVHLVSTDYTQEQLNLLRRGIVDGLIVSNMRAMGERAVENIAALRRGQPAPAVSVFEPVLITQKNMDSEPIKTLLKMDWRALP